MSDVPIIFFPAFIFYGLEERKFHQADFLLSSIILSVVAFPHSLLGEGGEIVVIEELVSSVLQGVLLPT